MEEKCSQRWLCQCFLLFAVIFLWDQAGGKSALLLWVCVSVGNVTVSSRVEQGIKKGGNRRDGWLFLVLTALFLGGSFSLISNECTSAMKDGQPSQSQASQFLRQLFWGAAVTVVLKQSVSEDGQTQLTISLCLIQSICRCFSSFRISSISGRWVGQTGAEGMKPICHWTKSSCSDVFWACMGSWKLFGGC